MNPRRAVCSSDGTERSDKDSLLMLGLVYVEVVQFLSAVLVTSCAPARWQRASRVCCRLATLGRHPQLGRARVPILQTSKTWTGRSAYPTRVETSLSVQSTSGSGRIASVRRELRRRRVRVVSHTRPPPSLTPERRRSTSPQTSFRERYTVCKSAEKRQQEIAQPLDSKEGLGAVPWEEYLWCGCVWLRFLNLDDTCYTKRAR
jgi:hypothetical protein